MAIDEESVLREEDYSLLKDFRLELEGGDGDGEELRENGSSSFTLCFWLYLMSSTTFPATILRRQVLSDVEDIAPFIVLNKKKQVILFPVHLFHKEDLASDVSISLTEFPHASSDTEFPLERWVHIGCEVSTHFVRLHIDGELIGNTLLSSSLKKDCLSSSLRKIVLFSSSEDEKNVKGYVHNAEFLPLPSSVKDHYCKDLPLQLSIDNSSAAEIEEGDDGVWSIVGGKASCRRNFSLDVLLLDSSRQPVLKETEVAASLLYADDGELVPKTSDEEAPLLASNDGIEFPSSEKPINLLHGRASFRLKISQLSSKCDNRLFRIRFYIPRIGKYPFFETYSPPIRCISRSKVNRVSSLLWKRPVTSIKSVDITQLSGRNNGTSELEHKSTHQEIPSPSKRIRLGPDSSSANFNHNHSTFEQPDEECNSHAYTTNQGENAFATNLVGRHENNGEAVDASTSDSESTEERNSAFNTTSSSRNPVSDVNIFKYCLSGLTERSLLLKEIATSVTNEEVLEFAGQISLYSGCSHHRNQILMSKRLIEEGTQAWNSISQNNHHVLWESAVFEIEEIFTRISCCKSRSLKLQDFELLRRIAGCQEYLGRENFERMWCWLYPIAFTVSREWINAIWSSMSPKWIEGFITKEEAESSLQGPRGLQDPGTFILRFPTSRSWPHPDAGNLVVTYVGSDYSLHHRLLSLDHMYSCSQTEKKVTPLKDMLLAEPELSRLGRIVRSH